MIVQDLKQEQMTFENRLLRLGQISVRGMGTIISLTVYCQQPDDKLQWLEQKLREYEHRFSANNATSELMEVNNAAGKNSVVVHPQLFDLIKIGKEKSVASDDLLNIAIGPLIQTWRIGFKDANRPRQAEIDQVLKLINPQDIILDANRQSVFLKKKGMKIDLGSLAKGYIADLLVKELKEQQVEAGLMNLGGNVITFGECPLHDDGLWRIGIRDPKGERENCLMILPLRDKSVVTSGIYERVLEISDKQYTHIFDGQTGYPVQTDIASLTIVSDKSLDGELWTTRLFGYSTERTKEIIKRKQLEGVVVSTIGDKWVSERIRKGYLQN